MIPCHPPPLSPHQPRPMTRIPPTTIKTNIHPLNAFEPKVSKRMLTLNLSTADKDVSPIVRVLLPEVSIEDKKYGRKQFQIPIVGSCHGLNTAMTRILYPLRITENPFPYTPFLQPYIHTTKKTIYIHYKSPLLTQNF